MIDIVTEKESKIRNVKQIGTPPEEDRIYLLDSAYKQMHGVDTREKSVYVLMGHTEQSNSRYATFVEAAIPIRDIEFERNVPVWSNQVWKSIFIDIKNQYEDMIIVGWGLDRKGFDPCETPELEKVHREQFGGMHQLLFLMNSLEQEEYFFINKNNRLYRKTGFFIYYQMKTGMLEKKKQENEEPQVNIEIPESLVSGEGASGVARGRYRELMKQQNTVGDVTPHMESKSRWREEMRSKGSSDSAMERRSSVGIVAAIAILVVVIGGNAMTHGIFSDQVRAAVETMGQSVNHSKELKDLESVDSEVETETEVIKIPVEEY